MEIVLIAKSEMSDRFGKRLTCKTNVKRFPKSEMSERKREIFDGLRKTVTQSKKSEGRRISCKLVRVVCPKCKLGERRREIRNDFIKIGSERKTSERRRKREGERLVEFVTKSETFERGREKQNWLVKIFSKCKMCDAKNRFCRISFFVEAKIRNWFVEKSVESEVSDRKRNRELRMYNDFSRRKCVNAFSTGYTAKM